jgi:hypothetical protein
MTLRASKDECASFTSEPLFETAPQAAEGENVPVNDDGASLTKGKYQDDRTSELAFGGRFRPDFL